MENKLVKVDKDSFIYKIKQFFSKWFYKKTSDNINSDGKSVEHIVNKDFSKGIRNVELDEILELQKAYRNNKLNVQDLSSEQVIAICKVYDKQIAELKRQNKIKAKKIVKYRENMKAVN